MTFKNRKMSSLNESVLDSFNTDSDKLNIVGSVEQDFVAAAVDQQKREEKTKEDFKDFDKNVDEFIKTNENREVKVEKDAGLKKMKLSESIFEEAVEFGDPKEMGRGVCAPIVPNYTRTIKQAISNLDTPETKDIAETNLRRYLHTLMDVKQSVENFNAYWTERYPAAIDYIDKQIALVPSKVLTSSTSQDVSEAVSSSKQQYFVGDSETGRIYNSEKDAKSAYDYLVKKGIKDAVMHKIEDKDELVESPVAEPSVKKRARSENEKKYKGDYSSEDLWLAVYDELSAELDNEGSGQQVDKKIKAKKGERYEHVYPVEGSNDLVVYAMTPDKFDFAKRVCDYYGVTYDEPKEDKNRMTNSYYKYSMRIHIPEDEIYQWD